MCMSVPQTGKSHPTRAPTQQRNSRVWNQSLDFTDEGGKGDTIGALKGYPLEGKNVYEEESYGKTSRLMRLWDNIHLHLYPLQAGCLLLTLLSLARFRQRKQWKKSVRSLLPFVCHLRDMGPAHFQFTVTGGKAKTCVDMKDNVCQSLCIFDFNWEATFPCMNKLMGRVFRYSTYQASKGLL